MLHLAAPLRHHDDRAHAARQVDDLGKDDVAKGQTEEQPQRSEDVGQGQGHQHLEEHLPWRGAQSQRRLHIALLDAGDGARGVEDDEHDAGDEDEHDLLLLADAEPDEGERDERGDRDIAAEDRDRGDEGAELGPGAAQDAERDADERGQTKPLKHAPQRGQQVSHQRLVEPERGETAEDLRRRADDRARQNALLDRTARHRGPQKADEGEEGESGEQAEGARGRLTQLEEAAERLAGADLERGLVGDFWRRCRRLCSRRRLCRSLWLCLCRGWCRRGERLLPGRVLGGLDSCQGGRGLFFLPGLFFQIRSLWLWLAHEVRPI